MQQWRLCILILLLGMACKTWSNDTSIKEKYPNVLLTDDHGILNENDLAAYTQEIKSAPFSIKEGKDYNYWQCFPRDHISITLEDKGYSSEDIGWKENYGDLKIAGWLDGSIAHEYFMRRPWPVDGYQKKFSQWQKLMEHEKYVCLAGRFSRYEETIQGGTKYQTYFWMFDKIKTKKGCDSYFLHQCNRS